MSTFYKMTLILSWSRQRMKHIYKTMLDEMKSLYFTKCTLENLTIKIPVNFWSF